MHSQHSVHSTPGSRMDGMAFYPFRNMNKRTRAFHILAILIPELSIKKRTLKLSEIASYSKLARASKVPPPPPPTRRNRVNAAVVVTRRTVRLKKKTKSKFVDI